MRFYQPRQREYQSTFNAVPLEFLNNTLKAKQADFDKAELYQNDLMKNLNVTARKQDIPKLKEIQDQYSQRVEKLADQYKGDKGSYGFIKELRNLAVDMNKDLTAGSLYAIKTNKEAFDQWNKTVKEQKDAYKPYLDEAYTNIADPFYKGAVDEEGQLNITSPGRIDPYLDRAKRADEIVKGIAAEGNAGWQIQTRNGQNYIVDSKGKAVTNEKIKETFLPAFQQTEEFNQLHREANFLDKSGILAKAGLNKDQYIQQQTEELLKGVQSKYRMSEYDVNAKADEYSLEGFKKKLEEDTVRFSMQGMGINPGTLEKSSTELNDNISKFQSSINVLTSYRDKIPQGTPEWNKVDAQIAWNKMQLKSRNEIVDKYKSEAEQKLSDKDKQLIKTLDNFDPSNISDPIVNSIIKNTKGLENVNSEAQLKKLFKVQSFHNKEGIGDIEYKIIQAKLKEKGITATEDNIKNYHSVMIKKDVNIDNLLKNSSEKYTIQPSLIEVDGDKSQTTSKQIEKLFNDGMGSWQVFDENGPITDNDLIPKSLKIKQISEQPVDELGYLFSGVEEVLDDDGKPTGEKKRYYIRPSGEHNINEQIGKDLIKENKSITTSQAQSRLRMGLNMVYPEYANQVSDIQTGFSKDVVSGNKVVANVEKKKTPAGEVYTIKAEGYDPKNYGSQEEVLEVLRILNQGQ